MGSAVVTKKMLEELNRSLCSSELPPVRKKSALAISLVDANRPKESAEKLQRLIDALILIPSDSPRGIGKIELGDDEPTDYWLGVIWAIAGLDWTTGREAARCWSKRSDRYTDEGFDAAWSSYNPDHPNPIGIQSLYRLAEKFDSDTPKAKETTVSNSDLTPISVLNKLSVTGSSKQMRLKMLADKFVMKALGILGQWTAFYAAPNTGKTLLTLWLLQEQISAGVIDANKVYYVNADDTYRGAVDKTEIAERLSMQMLIPNMNEFKPSYIPILMQKLAETEEAKGVVLVLDTLKKFTDLMDKGAASAFGNIARGFVAAGGTLICLAHTNKHKDSEGKGIYSGTSDIVDDADCVYIINKISADGNDLSRVHTVEFNNIKARGDVDSTAAFTYTRSSGQEYSALLKTVQRISTSEAKTMRKKAEASEQLDQDDDVIQALTSSIRQGIVTKSELIQSAMADTAESRAKVKGVLERWTGNDYAEGYRWTYKAGDHNKFSYSLTTPPSNS